jgi:hypothetical protein
MATDAGMPQTCNSMTCNNGFSCCGTECVNLGDDPRNCGHCSTPCSGATPVCLVGKCVETPCFRVPDAGACPTDGYCCGNLCCAKGQICCFVPAILELPRCVDPETSGGTCPKGCPTCVCASPDTPIATPTGVRAIAALRVGDPVLSVDHGRIATVLVAAVHRAEAPHHFVVHVELANGASLDISALHPTADGRTFGDLHAGDLLGGVRIERVRTVPYDASFTYDILPASDSGTYFAGGVLIGSTLGGDALASRGTDYAAMTLDFPGRTKGHD